MMAGMWAVVRRTLLTVAAGWTAAAGLAAERPVHLVELTEAPLSRRDCTGDRLDARSPASRAVVRRLHDTQDRFLAAAAAELGRELQPVFRYVAAANGLALRLAPEEAALLAARPEVLRVVPDRLHRLLTDASPEWLGATEVWAGVGPANPTETMGEHVLVGVVDTGINMGHPAFSDAPPDGHRYVNPFGPGVWVGWCDPAHPSWDPAWVCNDKLVGAWDFADVFGEEADGPEDAHNHGSHVASVVAGNRLAAPAMSGVAPHASLVSYDACYLGPGFTEVCPLSASVAAIDQALLDGVDVLTISFDGGTDPWGDVDVYLLNAVAAGVFVAAAAGNDGPDPGVIEHRGPWVATAAAATHHRIDNRTALTDLGGGDAPPLGLEGSSLVGGHGPAPVVWAGDFGNGTASPETCQAPFPEGTWSADEIVVCDYAAGLTFLACQNVALGGAGGCVLANAPGVTYVAAHAHLIPATHLDAASGDLLRVWLASGTGHTATLTASSLVRDPQAADRVADFSSRGPAPGLEILKPDLAAPGVRILGAMRRGLIPGFTGPAIFQMSGTSMAAPHVAGAGALLVGLQRGLSPAEIRSALMLTARPALDEDGLPADPFTAGSGRLDVAAASRAGLVMHETPCNFGASDPDLGGDPRQLNLPALVDGGCARTCGWMRTVRTTRSDPLLWGVVVTPPPGLSITVEPQSFVVGSEAPFQDLVFSATVLDAAQLGQWLVGEVRLVPDRPGMSVLRMPIVVVATAPASLLFGDGFESGDVSAWSGGFSGGR
jgi:subtilisin family serine protease